MSIKMNKKGLLFTIMTLFLIFGILALNEALQDATRGYSPTPEAIELYSIGNSFRNASSILFDLDKNGYARTTIENIYPFTYSLGKDSNTFSLGSEFSLNSVQINEVFDYLNMTKIILTDSNYSHAFSGTTLDINAPKNSYWGGTNSQVSFLILPFCYKYIIFDTNSAGFSKTTSALCNSNFDSSKIRRFDININILTSTSDFNTLLCDGGACVKDTFNPANPNPFYSINIVDSNCDSCAISQKIISGHFATTAAKLFELKCSGALCTSPALTIKLSNMDWNYSYASDKKINILTKITFTQAPEGFIVENMSITAKSGLLNVQKNSN